MFFFNQVITFLRWLTTVTAKEVTSRKKPHGKRKRLTVVSLGREVFSFAVSLFLSAVRFLLLSRVFLFCREVISFAVTVVGHRTFCWRESFPFCGEVPPFVASLSLLPRGYFFCRDSCGPSYFLLPLTHKAEIQGSLLFFFSRIERCCPFLTISPRYRTEQ